MSTATAYSICPTCLQPHSGAKCDNPGCVESGNVPPEILARRRREAEEERSRQRISRIRERLGL